MQKKILLHPQFEHKQEPAQDQSEGGRPRDGGHSQPHTGNNLITDLILTSCWDPADFCSDPGGRVLFAKAKLVRLQTQD